MCVCNSIVELSRFRVLGFCRCPRRCLSINRTLSLYVLVSRIIVYLLPRVCIVCIGLDFRVYVCGPKPNEALTVRVRARVSLCSYCTQTQMPTQQSSLCLSRHMYTYTHTHTHSERLRSDTGKGEERHTHTQKKETGGREEATGEGSWVGGRGGLCGRGKGNNNLTLRSKFDRQSKSIVKLTFGARIDKPVIDCFKSRRIFLARS